MHFFILKLKNIVSDFTLILQNFTVFFPWKTSCEIVLNIFENSMGKIPLNSLVFPKVPEV